MIDSITKCSRQLLFLVMLIGLCLRLVLGQSAGADESAVKKQQPSVVIIEYSDFECGFCGKVSPVLEQLKRLYPNELEIIFKHNPLPFHHEAPLAHEAAIAAGEQGKFWQMHDALFAHQQQLDHASLLSYARNIGLDVIAFESALDSHRHRAAVERDTQEAKALGVTSTPTFFLNGQKLVGAQPLAAFQKAIDRSLGRPDEEIAKQLREIDLRGSYHRGAPTAPITIIGFTDFQCGYCSRVQPTLNQLLDEYHGQIQFVFKNFPLEFHADAALAHEAALAAGAQGKFWEMHDSIYSKQATIRREDLLQTARSLGLDMERFTAELDGHKWKALVDADKQLGTKLGIDGTPSFFVNGKPLFGAQPISEFKRLIESELKVASAVNSAMQATATPNPPDPIRTRGPETAQVTITWFADVQSGLTRNAETVLGEIERAYPGKIRTVFKHLPMDIHPDAALAHEAVMAAGANGKFWEMQHLLMQNQQHLQKSDLLYYAGSLGLSQDDMRRDLESRKYKPAIDQDLREAASLQVRGSPVFFINGKRMDGVQSVAAFKQFIDGELKPGVSSGAVR